MEKKLYVIPETYLIIEEPEEMMVISGGSDDGDLHVALDEDLSDDIQRARIFE